MYQHVSGRKQPIIHPIVSTQSNAGSAPNTFSPNGCHYCTQLFVMHKRMQMSNGTECPEQADVRGRQLVYPEQVFGEDFSDNQNHCEGRQGELCLSHPMMYHVLTSPSPQDHSRLPKSHKVVSWQRGARQIPACGPSVMPETDRSIRSALLHTLFTC